MLKSPLHQTWDILGDYLRCFVTNIALNLIISVHNLSLLHSDIQKWQVAVFYICDRQPQTNNCHKARWHPCQNSYIYVGVRVRMPTCILWQFLLPNEITQPPILRWVKALLWRRNVTKIEWGGEKVRICIELVFVSSPAACMHSALGYPKAASCSSMWQTHNSILRWVSLQTKCH